MSWTRGYFFYDLFLRFFFFKCLYLRLSCTGHSLKYKNEEADHIFLSEESSPLAFPLLQRYFILNTSSSEITDH